MKKIVINLFFVFTLQSIFSQSATITSSINPVPKLSFKTIDFAVNEDFLWEMEQSGENTTWTVDAANMITTDTAEWEYISVNETPYGNLFPDATIAMTCDKESFEYFYFDDNEWYIIGGISLDSAYSEQYVYDKHGFGFSFPLKYGEKWDKNYRLKGDISRALGENIREEYKTLTISERNEVDTYGTLILPYQTFENTIRVKTEAIEYDTLRIGTKVSSRKTQYTHYKWYVDGIKIPVFTITIQKTLKHQKVTGTCAILREKELLTDTQIFPFAALVYPNPGHDEINIEYHLEKQKKVKITLFDVMGKTVAEYKYPNSLIGENIIHISTQQLATGLYEVLIEAGQEWEIIKWFKI